ncbi:MAG: hypothetical protein ACK53F_05810 [Betaproteobacteria bacterium]|jgi:hypothetical protein
MNLVEADFDESGTHDGSPVICMGGYIFDAAKSESLAAEWQAMLNAFGNGDVPLPFFHMSECTKVSKSTNMGVGICKHSCVSSFTEPICSIFDQQNCTNAADDYDCHTQQSTRKPKRKSK